MNKNDSKTRDPNDREPEPDPKSPSSSDRDPLGPILESFLARFRKGERPSLTEYIARYPALADEIRELLPALVEIEQLGSVGGASRAGLGEPRPVPGSPSATDAADPAAKPAAAIAVGTSALAFPQRLGDYRILRTIGAGAWAWSTRRCGNRSAATWR